MSYDQSGTSLSQKPSNIATGSVNTHQSSDRKCTHSCFVQEPLTWLSLHTLGIDKLQSDIESVWEFHGETDRRTEVDWLYTGFQFIQETQVVKKLMSVLHIINKSMHWAWTSSCGTKITSLEPDQRMFTIHYIRFI